MPCKLAAKREPSRHFISARRSSSYVLDSYSRSTAASARQTVGHLSSHLMQYATRGAILPTVQPSSLDCSVPSPSLPKAAGCGSQQTRSLHFLSQTAGAASIMDYVPKPQTQTGGIKTAMQQSIPHWTRTHIPLLASQTRTHRMFLGVLAPQAGSVCWQRRMTAPTL
jgi:hypothetical protein